MEEPAIKSVPSRYRYMAGVLDGLRSLGGEAPISRVYEWLIAHEIAYPDDLTTFQSDGGSRFHKEVRWARKELFDTGLLRAPDRGTWALTEIGLATQMTPAVARQMVSALASQRRLAKVDVACSAISDQDQSPAEEQHRERGPTTGPVPSAWSRQVTRTTSDRTWTYLVRFGERDVWKIGHAANIIERLTELNKHVPSEVLGESWSVVGALEWADATAAYVAEQRALNQLQPYRTVGERLRCPEEAIKLSWQQLGQFHLLQANRE
jgi:hypothetical protein